MLGKHTIAEFVENDTLLEAVREIGVDFSQDCTTEKHISNVDRSLNLIPVPHRFALSPRR